MEAAIQFGKLYFVVCCILLCIGFGYSGKPYTPTRVSTHVFVVDEDVFPFLVELQPSSESVEVCSGTTVQVNCTTATDHLFWRAPPECFVSYNKDDTALVGVVRPFCDFEAILLSTDPSLMSTATLSNVSSFHNGTVLTCVNTIVQVGLGPDQMASIIFLARGNVHHEVPAHVFACYWNRNAVFSFILEPLFLRSSLCSTQPFIFSTVPEFCGTFLDSQ